MTINPIVLKKVYKSFGSHAAVNALDLTVCDGMLLVLLGPSGCGKTTTLRLIAGLDAPDRGEVWIDGELVAGKGVLIPPEKRRIGMVFQDYALFPHMTIAANIAFALNGAKNAKQRIGEMLDLVGLGGKAERYPHQLSGGEQQRVALARALAPRPAVVLLDEPFSNLDAALRKEMRQEIKRILREAQTTAVFVTHDQEEALSLADCVAVMKQGQLLQVGSPQTVYLRPENREVADFLGEANFLPGVADGKCVLCALGQLQLATPIQGDVEVMLRPEALRLEVDSRGDGVVSEVKFFGHDQIVTVCLESGLVVQARAWGITSEFEVGARVHVTLCGKAMAYVK
ncbi:MAG: ABC transporter ATP-binding protein [Anaerolineae bacterium]|jgi:iron(III) transport system ATP-binding protein|nr:ABC transporter ATP-binding protein [Anaerolineae bacterium]